MSRDGLGANATRSTTATNDPDTSSPVSGDAVRWSRSFDRPIRQSPVVAGDRLYIATGEVVFGPENDHRQQTGAVAALDAGDGRLRWQSRTAAPPMQAPTVSDDVYVVTGYSDGFSGIDNRLRKFDLDGTPVWQSDTVRPFLRLLAVDDQHAYLGTNDDAVSSTGEELFAVDLDDGERRWTTSAGDARRGWRRDDSLIGDGWVATTVRDPTDGEERFSVGGSVVADATDEPVYAAGHLLVDQDDDGVVMVGVEDDNTSWTYERSTDGGFVTTGGAVHEDFVIGQEYGGLLFALSLADGSERWTTTVPGETRTEPVYEAGTLYVGTTADHVVAIDATRGTERWRRPVGRRFPRPTAVSDTELIVVSSWADNRVFSGIDPSDGTQRWEFAETMATTRPAVSGDTTYVGREDGVLIALGR